MHRTNRFQFDRRPVPAFWAGLVLLGLSAFPGCTHRIEVHPTPSRTASVSIPRSLQVTTGNLTIQGADHMPGITLLEWLPRDFTQAALNYIRQRGTFSSVSGDSADLAMKLTARLSMVSRGPYVYSIRLHADMGTAATPIKSYDVERSATGSSVRWVTASDRDPIEAALQSALEDLLTNIETDRALFFGNEPVKGGKP
ncbi:MAG: hypothetical protein RL768_2787 [Nitrospirota bacterium]|jgi:hypothetical protein